MKGIHKSFRNALYGLKVVWREERNFKIEVNCALLVLILSMISRLNMIEMALIVISILLVISGEIINTVVEDLCNKIQPLEDSRIGKIKDMMASYVLVTSFGAVLIGLFVFINHFF